MILATYFNQLLSKIETEDDFIFLDGTNKVLLTAPHFVEHIKNGVYLPSEPMTGLIACYLNDHFSCPSFIQLNKECDANYDEKSEFRDRVLAYCKEHDVKVVLDLHELSPVRTQACNINTMQKRTVLGYPELGQQIRDLFITAGFHRANADSSGNSFEHTISTVMSDNGIVSLQIEINRNLFFLQEKTNMLIEALSNAIKLINEVVK